NFFVDNVMAQYGKTTDGHRNTDDPNRERLDVLCVAEDREIPQGNGRGNNSFNKKIYLSSCHAEDPRHGGNQKLLEAFTPDKERFPRKPQTQAGNKSYERVQKCSDYDAVSHSIAPERGRQDKYPEKDPDIINDGRESETPEIAKSVFD